MKGLSDLVDTNFNFLEPEKYDPSGTRVKLSTDATLSASRINREIPAELAKRLNHWNLKEVSLAQDILEKILFLLDDNADVFAKSEYDVGNFVGFKHSINTGDHPPIKAKPRPLSHAKLQCLAKILDELLAAKLIRPSRSDWACGIVLVPKKNGDWRLCIDYRPINKIATCCQFPLPRISDMLRSLRGSKYFSALDLNKGFHQIPLEDASKPKLAFVTPLGLYEWEKTPFGIHSGPAAFQAAMHMTLAGLEHCTMVYIDDIIVYTPDLPSHFEALKEVFARLRKFDLRASREKCEFCRTEVAYLGHIINAQGIKTDPKKTAAVKDMPEPTCTVELETFLGKAGYYQKFIDDYANIAHPLMRMKGKNVDFQFGNPEREAFNKLKEALCSAPVLRYPDFERPFYISTDASGYGLGAVLFQVYGEDNQDELPVGYASRSLKDAELRYSATEREALAVWWACEHFIDFIDDREVTIYTDHKALLALPHKELNNRRLQLIAHKLQEFRYEIKYRPGKQNANADALSRYPIVPCRGKRSREVQTNESRTNGFDPEANLSDPKFMPKFKRTLKERVQKAKVPKSPKKAKEDKSKSVSSLPETHLTGKIAAINLSLPAPRLREVARLLDNIVTLQEQVPEFKAIRAYIKDGCLPEQPKLRQELIRQLDAFICDDANDALCKISGENVALCVPPELYETVLYDSHTAPSAGHLGVIKTLARVRQHYWWPALVKSVTEYVAKCPLCQAHKERPRPPREPLGDRPPPKNPWERLHMDIWGPGRPAHSGNRYVLGVVDTFSKYLVLIPIPNQTAVTVADAIVERVMLPYGMPSEIVSDQALSFTAALQAELYAIFGVTRRVSTPYRPQANGQIERMFRTIRPILATLTNKTPRNWDKYLALTAYSYNTSYHAAVKNTPFYILHGREPRPLPEQYNEAGTMDNVQRLRRWKLARETTATGLCEEQQRSKIQHDAFRARPQRAFKAGDHVLVRVVRVPREIAYKIYPKYIGPYRVLRITNAILTVTPIYLPASAKAKRKFNIHKDRVRHCEANYPNVHTWRELISVFTDPNIDMEEDET